MAEAAAPAPPAPDAAAAAAAAAGDPPKPEEPPKPPPPVKRSESVIAREKEGIRARSEVEHTIKRISSHRGVVGTVIVDKHCVPLRTSMDEATTHQYAAFITPLIHRAQMICLNHDKVNPLTMFRFRTRKTEVIVIPGDEHYLMAVQNVSHIPELSPFEND